MTMEGTTPEHSASIALYLRKRVHRQPPQTSMTKVAALQLLPARLPGGTMRSDQRTVW
jgi:hypothetical protein